MNATRDAIRNAQTEAPKARVEAPEGTAPVKEPKTPKVAKAPHACKCNVPTLDKFPGCNGATTTRVFAPGHDAKLTGYLTRRVVAGSVTKAEALEDLVAKGGSKNLVAKLASAIDRETVKVQGAAKREADKLAAKADREAKSKFAKEQSEAAKLDAKAKAEADA